MPENEKLSAIKDRELVEKRRTQMVKGAMKLFKEKGFHRTTTREIAKEAGFSIGTLYEYIRKKEDVLFFVVDAIYDQVRSRLREAMDLQYAPAENLVKVTEAYFILMDEMQEEVLIMYQEVKSLNKESLDYVLQKERDMVDMLKNVIIDCLPQNLSTTDAELLANNIFVQGQMWGFRRWMLQKQFTLKEYIERQLTYLKYTLHIPI
ncbi:TetR/AcrR family transcriptional regulator [Virgibacillus sp. 179-BFC.A HS]|uniref:TetR/AcrR family transcriptional regulator n=1 Tax=Tigheibacillus jepli TaxID=3035914 RepID=A0ABU5CDX0_9BACI|nr:TetR/AcrR family transcriptional regulator [Virgibacillus sp. 179-BFC.A HS]MDY0404535.1 TetR/AcrR family transcriptional regulator [Virgibacillus sp. 179-BFC.A HS]